MDESASELPSSRVAFDEVYKARASSALPPRPPPRPSTAVKATSRAFAPPPEVASSPLLELPSGVTTNTESQIALLAPGTFHRARPLPSTPPTPPGSWACCGSRPSRPCLSIRPPTGQEAPPPHGPYLGGEAASPGRRTRTPRASEGEAERPRRRAERCSRPTAPAAPGRGGRARARGTRHAPGPPSRAARAPGTHPPRGGPGADRARRDCTEQRPGPGVRGRSRPEASPSPGMVCPEGNAHAPLLSHQHKVLPHCGESLEAHDDSDPDNSSPNSTESRRPRLVVAPQLQVSGCRSSSS